MSTHFEDARYNLARAADHARAGIKEELESVENEAREAAESARRKLTPTGQRIGRQRDRNVNRLDKATLKL